MTWQAWMRCFDCRAQSEEELCNNCFMRRCAYDETGICNPPHVQYMAGEVAAFFNTCRFDAAGMPGGPRSDKPSLGPDEAEEARPERLAFILEVNEEGTFQADHSSLQTVHSEYPENGRSVGSLVEVESARTFYEIAEVRVLRRYYLEGLLPAEVLTDRGLDLPPGVPVSKPIRVPEPLENQEEDLAKNPTSRYARSMETSK